MPAIKLGLCLKDIRHVASCFVTGPSDARKFADSYFHCKGLGITPFWQEITPDPPQTHCQTISVLSMNALSIYSFSPLPLAFLLVTGLVLLIRPVQFIKSVLHINTLLCSKFFLFMQHLQVFFEITCCCQHVRAFVVQHPCV